MGVGQRDTASGQSQKTFGERIRGSVRLPGALPMTEGTKHMSFSSASVSKTQGNLKVCPSLLPGMHKGTRSIKLGEMKEEKEMKEGEARQKKGARQQVISGI